MKKIEFGAKRPSTNQAGGLDSWVQGSAADNREPTKRFTIDVPASLHKRIKSQCAMQSLVMADVIRDLLEQRFPQSKDAEHTTPLADRVPS